MVAALIISSAILLVAAGLFAYQMYCGREVFKAEQKCITLINNEGIFTGLLVEKRRKRWSFENVKTVPQRNNELSQDIPGRLNVPVANILYWQDIAGK